MSNMSAPLNAYAIATIARSTYVILLKDDAGKLTLLVDPGMGRPCTYKNYAIAKFHASECDGEARTWEEAFKLLLKEHPGFEKELIERVAKAQQDFLKTQLDKNSLKHGINTDANHHRNSDGTILDAGGNVIPPADS